MIQVERLTDGQLAELLYDALRHVIANPNDLPAISWAIVIYEVHKFNPQKLDGNPSGNIIQLDDWRK